ncbi:MAG: DUF721 domain-containing protein [Candidatus Omnitrophica bacterium]|nr:DUF721 domain-containing protein [Candidatus Omnitrophota bacterium]
MELIKKVVLDVLSECQAQKQNARNQLLEKWPAIAGARFATHTRPSLSKSGILYIWVDQSSLAFELSQRYRQSLLKRIQALLGEKEVKAIRIRVGQLHPQ